METFSRALTSVSPRFGPRQQLDEKSPWLAIARIRSQAHSSRSIAMLSWALMFLIIALIAGVLGFGLVAGLAATIAKVCFVVFIVLFLISLIGGRRINV
jgi:uncharacterized membrane protein YtjA (UPF0391 family)